MREKREGEERGKGREWIRGDGGEGRKCLGNWPCAVGSVQGDSTVSVLNMDEPEQRVAISQFSSRGLAFPPDGS